MVNCISVSLIKQLRDETGVGLYEAKEALELCGDKDVAKEFLRLYHAAVKRYKYENGKKIPYTKEDYVILAKKRKG